MTPQKQQASAWFEVLRDQICSAFERIEDDSEDTTQLAGRFERMTTERDGGNGGGGVASIMKGRVFEKVGVNISTVHGVLPEKAQQSITARKEIPGLSQDPRFWASGISLVAHMRSPKCPAVHMNTRMFWTPQVWWFGGGADLNPSLDSDADTAAFHHHLKQACDAHNPAYYPEFKKWADEYFMITHRKKPRGVGGIFYDDLCTGDWEVDFAFTQDVGRAFLTAFEAITRQHMDESWTEDERTQQLIRRGHYAEFNLIYDRGTKFGLETGHNVDAVLMSLPPVAIWP